MQTLKIALGLGSVAIAALTIWGGEKLGELRLRREQKATVYIALAYAAAFIVLDDGGSMRQVMLLIGIVGAIGWASAKLVISLHNQEGERNH